MTPEREKRIREVLSKRQFDLTVVLEHVWDPHNISAVLRTCDSIGIQEVYIISPKNKTSSKLGKKSSASASKWLTIHHFDEVKICFKELRNRYHKVYSTRLLPGSVSIYEIDFTDSAAILFGNEKLGVSDEASQLSDANIVIPQVGLIPSLNISVACAVTLYECFRQRSLKSFYKGERFSDRTNELYENWKKK